MKKSVSVILVVIFVLSALSLNAFAAGSATSTAYRYETKFNLANLFYNDFSLITDETCPVPGLENTNVAGDNCSAMTPQGLCVSEDYIFITAYCAVDKYKSELEEYKDSGSNTEKLEKEKNHQTHNSVIYIIDRKSGEYIKTLVLSDSNHVGGIACDGKVLYIAKSSDKEISVIKLSNIKKAIKAKSDSVKIKYNYTVDCGCTASFVTCYEGVLWVGVFNEKENGELVSFKVNSNNYKLTKKYSLPIPAKANGACFTELDGEVCLAINTSYGRKNPSQIYLFSVESYGKNDMVITEKARYITPPTVQNCDIIDGKVYYLYESAATCYSEVESDFSLKATTCAVDRICIGDETKLFNWHSKEDILTARLNAFIEAFKTMIVSFIG